MNANITSIGKFLPNKVVNNSVFEDYLDTTDEWIISRTGIKERCLLENGKASSFMAIKAIEDLFDKTNISPNEIDAIIVATITPDMVFPSTACIIQNHFKIDNCWGYDLSAACSGFLFGLETGDALIKSKKYDKVIVVGVDKSGCSGYSYKIDFVKSADLNNYECVKVDDFKIYIDPKATIFLVGSVMDYKVDKMSSRFIFKNPNETSTCGCGESFTI